MEATGFIVDQEHWFARARDETLHLDDHSSHPSSFPRKMAR
jgi:hypothetical protein